MILIVWFLTTMQQRQMKSTNLNNMEVHSDDEKKTAKLNFYTTVLTLTDNNHEKRQWQLKVDKIETEIAPLGKKVLIKRGCPICSTHDSILNKSNITPQVYHRQFHWKSLHQIFQSRRTQKVNKTTRSITETYRQSRNP